MHRWAPQGPGMSTSNGMAGQGNPEVERASGQRDQQEQTQGEGILLWTIHSSAPFTVSSLALLCFPFYTWTWHYVLQLIISLLFSLFSRT